MLVPGLLQSEAYAKAVVHTSLPWLPAETVDKQVQSRMKRAAIWKREERPAFWAVMHESLVRKPLLPPGEMAAQLEHIGRAVAVEIARIPSTAARLRAAEDTAQTIDQGDPAWRRAMDEILTLHTSARESLPRE